jgi:hypothetical protein
VKAIRKYSSIGQLTYTENGHGRLDTRIVDGEFALEFQNSDRFAMGINDDYEYLKAPFAVILPTVRVPIGGYRFTTGRIGYNFGQQRPYSGNLLVERGSFYTGDRTTITFNRSRLNLSPQFSLEPTASVNWVDLPQGKFIAKLVGSRVTYTVTPLMFMSALLQFNSTTNSVSANVRLRWEYRPGSELFLVYNEDRDTLARDFPATRNRAVILKVNRFFRL